MENVRFHLAIPSKNILDSIIFYSSLGCKIGRSTEQHCIIDFFGSQVVCHLHNFIEEQKDIYPRHFGVILDEKEFTYICRHTESINLEKYRVPFIRHGNTTNEHTTFFLKDPSGNYIEFKHYKDERAI